MLSNLVPGIRDIRTPVVVGALWGAVAWIIVRWHFGPEAVAVQDFLSRSPLLQWRDHLLLGVVGAFAAYVTGVAVTLDPGRGSRGASSNGETSNATAQRRSMPTI